MDVRIDALVRDLLENKYQNADSQGVHACIALCRIRDEEVGNLGKALVEQLAEVLDHGIHADLNLFLLDAVVIEKSACDQK